MQLMFDGARWWMVSIVWDTERDGNPILKDTFPSRVRHLRRFPTERKLNFSAKGATFE